MESTQKTKNKIWNLYTIEKFDKIKLKKNLNEKSWFDIKHGTDEKNF